MMRDLSREPDRSMLGLEPLLVCARDVPDDCKLLLLEGGSEGSDPAGVALKGAAEDELLSHFDV
jgi:hypothetical protein